MSRILQAPKRLSLLLRRLADDRRGVSAIITAIALTTLAGFCGLAVDVVIWEVNQRTVQGVADQAALAAATAYRSAGETQALADSTTARNAAYAVAIRNGYTSDQITVAAYSNGGTCTNNGCLKVTITQPQPKYFTGVFFNGGISDSASAVGTCNGCGNGAFAVSSNGGDPCVMALDSAGRGVVSTTGGATMSLTSCNLYNNAPNTDATIVTNNASIEGCSSTNACGSKAYLAQPNDPGGIDIPVVTNSAPAPDPYANVTPPTVDSNCQELPNPPTNVPSGTYCGGNHFQNMTITFADNAVIVIKNGLDLHSGSTSLTGTHVLLYVQTDGTSSQASTLNATTTISITAPNSGPYAGIGMWFAGGSDVTINGSNTSLFKGAVYAPQSDVSFAGGANAASNCTRLIGASVSLTGNSTATFNNTGCEAVAGPVQTASGVTGTTPYQGSPMLVQ